MTNPTQPMANGKQPDTLRDARLAKALQHMPDAHMQPSALTRNAVLQEAMRAVGTTASQQPSINQRRWWHTWLGQPGHRMPWAAAVASVALFGFITVMWYGQDVPDATPQRSEVAQNTVGDMAELATPAAAPAAAPAIASAIAEASAKKAAEPDARVAASAETPRTAAESEHKLAKLAKPAAEPPATPATGSLAAPVAPATADAVAQASAVDVPAAPARLERRSKGTQPELAAMERAQTREVAQANAGAVSVQAARAPAMAAAAPAPPAAPMAGVGAKALSDTAVVWQLTVGNAGNPIQAAQAQVLLTQLRGLVYDAAPTSRQDADLPADAIRLESAGQERWVITPEHVTHYRAAGGAAQSQERSRITPAQYTALRRLSMELVAQP